MLTTMIPRITVDTSSEALLHEDGPILLEFNSFRDQFGRSDMIIIAVEPQEVFSREFITWLGAFHAALAEEVPHIMDVTGLINARNTYGDADVLIVEDLFKDWEEKGEDWKALRQVVLGSIALGLVVDDTVHFMYNFRRYYEKRRDAYLAIRETLLGPAARC